MATLMRNVTLRSIFGVLDNVSWLVSIRDFNRNVLLPNVNGLGQRGTDSISNCDTHPAYQALIMFISRPKQSKQFQFRKQKNSHMCSLAKESKIKIIT